MSNTLLPNKESELIEYKESIAELKEGLISLAAMLNAHQEGTLYFGVNDKGAPIKDYPLSRGVERDIRNAFNHYFDPKISSSISELVINGKRIVKIHVQSARILFTAYGKINIRSGSSNVAMPLSKIKELAISAASVQWDEEVTSFTTDEVNPTLLKEFVKESNESKRFTYRFDNVKNVVNKLNLTKNGKLINAGYITFGRSAKIESKYGIFQGISKVEIISTDISQDNLWNSIKTAYQYLVSNIKIRVELPKNNLKSMARKSIPEIPVEALREALINSFIHRDYVSRDANEILIYRDRIEIFNPGQFYGKDSIQKYIEGKGRTSPRNRILSELLYKAGDIESHGSGIERIYNLCKDVGIRVDFANVTNGFQVTFWRKNTDIVHDGKVSLDSFEQKVSKVLKYVKNNKIITRKIIEQQFGFSNTTSKRIIRELIVNKSIASIGKTNNQRYKYIK